MMLEMNTQFLVGLRRWVKANHQNCIRITGKYSVHVQVQPYIEEVYLILLDTSMKTSLHIWKMLISDTGQEFTGLNVYTVPMQLYITI